jgi:ribonuclease VapC
MTGPAIILDTLPPLAVLSRAADAQRCSEAIAGAPRRAIAAATLAEGRGGAPLRGDMAAPLARARTEIAGHAARHAALAAEGRRRYAMGRHPAGLNPGDCFAHALAQSRGEPLLFKGTDFAQTDVKAAL